MQLKKKILISKRKYYKSEQNVITQKIYFIFKEYTIVTS